MTNAEAVSHFTNTLKANNKDGRYSRRYILNQLRNNAKVLISQKLLDRTITSEQNLYTYLPCFEFEKIEVVKCPIIEFRMCKTLMKSKNKLPELIFSRLGSSIKDIFSIDGGFRFSLVDKNQYNRNKKRQHSLKNEVYVYVDSDMHLYIPDHEIYSVDLSILTLKTEDLDDCSSCKENNCKSNWDYEFIVPDKLIDAVFNMTLQTLGISKQIVKDQNPNGVEGV